MYFATLGPRMGRGGPSVRVVPVMTTVFSAATEGEDEKYSMAAATLLILFRRFCLDSAPPVIFHIPYWLSIGYLLEGRKCEMPSIVQ